jgi:hypothetical protein
MLTGDRRLNCARIVTRIFEAFVKVAVAFPVCFHILLEASSYALIGRAFAGYLAGALFVFFLDARLPGRLKTLYVQSGTDNDVRGRWPGANSETFFFGQVPGVKVFCEVERVPNRRLSRRDVP